VPSINNLTGAYASKFIYLKIKGDVVKIVISYEASIIKAEEVLYLILEGKTFKINTGESLVSIAF